MYLLWPPLLKNYKIGHETEVGNIVRLLLSHRYQK